MAETIIAPADVAPAERPMPVGYRFHPTDQELVGHYLRRKLEADDLSIHDTIPEIALCKYEPGDLLAWAASTSATIFDELECFFFSPRDYKYSNSTRSNRATLRGFWKKTGKDRKITHKDTNKVIGTKKTLVYHERCDARGVKTNWVVHEYHDAQLSDDKRTYVLCWLKSNNKKKIKENFHHLIDDEGVIDYEGGIISHVEYDNQSNPYPNTEGHYFSNRSLMNPVSSQSNEPINSMIQVSLESNEIVDSMIQTPFQPVEASSLIIHTPVFESNSTIVVDSVIQTSFKPTIQPNEAIDSMIQVPLESNETVDLTIQTPFQPVEASTFIIHTPISESNSTIAVDSTIQTSIKLQPEEAVDSMIQVHFESNETVDSTTHIPFQSVEASTFSIHTPISESNSTIAVDSATSMMHIMPSEPNSEPNSVIEASSDAGEFGLSLSDLGDFDFTSLLQSPRMDEQGIFEMLPPDMWWHEA